MIIEPLQSALQATITTAATGGGSSWFGLTDRSIWILMPVCGIVGGISIVLMVLHHNHKERMAKIRRGMDPDAEEDA